MTHKNLLSSFDTLNFSLSGDASLVESGFKNPPADPLLLFNNWLEQADALHVPEPKAFTLVTVGKNYKPSSRIVIFKNLTENGLVFGCSSASPKSIQMSQVPNVSGTFWWQKTIQQINFTGTVEKADTAISDRIFYERDRSARAISYLSRQSQPMENEPTLRDSVQSLATSDTEINRPESWCAYKIHFDTIEFFVGSPDRFHKRLQYKLEDKKWRHTMLQP